MKITKDVEEMLRTDLGCKKLIALKLCELVELMKPQTVYKLKTKSLWEEIFGHKANDY